MKLLFILLGTNNGNQFTVKFPYVEVCNRYVTPAFLLLIAYVVMLFLFYLIKRSSFHYSFSFWKNYNRGKINHIIRTMIGLIIGSIVFWLLPSFISDDSLLSQILEKYLLYEPIIAILIFLFLCSTILTVGNKKRQIEVSNQILLFFISISVFAGLFKRHIDLIIKDNWFILCFIYILYFVLLILDVEEIFKTEKNHFANISYNPIKDIDQLFPQHKATANKIVTIIKNSSPDPFSICLSGEWGTGKTSVSNCVETLLKQDKNKDYVIIRMNALELDNKASMLNYFMSEVKSSLVDRGVYVGISSEYANFFSSFIENISHSSFSIFLKKFLNNDEKDYRKQKIKLEKLLLSLFENGKLILIVDDIERCQPKVACEYMFLIKEVATMKNCVSIFVTDYNVMSELCKKYMNITSQNKKYDDYLNKFFNYKIDMNDENPIDIFNHYDSILNEDSIIARYIGLIEKTPKIWCEQILNRLDKKILKRKEYNDDKNKDYLNKVRNRFENIIKNPRNIVTYYLTFKDNVYRCYKDFDFKPYGYNEMLHFLKTRNISEVVHFLTFIKVYFPNEFIDFQKNNFDYILPKLKMNKDYEDSDKNFLYDIAEVTMYYFVDFSHLKLEISYITSEINRFINHFFDDNYDLGQLINPFDNQEQEWKNAIDKRDISKIEYDWEKMIDMVLSKIANNDTGIDEKWKKDSWSYLLQYACDKIKKQQWPINKLYTLVLGRSNARLFANNKGFFQEYSNVIKDFITDIIFSNEELELFYCFCESYLFNKTKHLDNLLYYILDDEQYRQIENNREMLRDSIKLVDENLSLYFDKIGEILPNFEFTDTGLDIKYYKIVDYITIKLIEKNSLEHKDILSCLLVTIDSMFEIDGLIEIFSILHKNSSEKRREVISMRFSKIDDMIKYFQCAFSTGCLKEKDFDFIQEFDDFFVYLKNTENIELSNEQIEELHKLITISIDVIERDSFYYRKVLMKYSQENTLA